MGETGPEDQEYQVPAWLGTAPRAPWVIYHNPEEQP